MSEDEQSELGDHDPTQNIAEELAEQQQQASIAEFFGKNKQMLGFDSKPRALVTAIKEAVDNALDACEEAGVLPDIYVNIERTDDYYRVTVEDNGPGITKEEIPKVFGQLLYGSRFHTREQSRGQQGIGISAAVLYSQRTSGKPSKIVSRAKGGDDANFYELIIDEENNEADIRREETVKWDKDHGTRITLEMDANMRARSQIHNYIRYTAVVNPHARVEFHEPEADLVYERSSDQLPPETKEIDPHPHGVELGTLITMIRSSDTDDIKEFLQNEFVRVGPKGAENILNNFRDRHYGRGMPWPVSANDDIHSLVADATDLPDDVATAFADALATRLDNADRLTYIGLEATVDAAANEAEVQTGSRIGDPLTAADPTAWAELGDEDGDSGTLDQWSDSPGTGKLGRIIGEKAKRKGDSAVELFTDSVTGQLADAARVSREDVGDIVAEAADAAEDETGETFGSKSRRNLRDAIWGELHEGRRDIAPRTGVTEAVWPAAVAGRAETLHEWLDEETTVQKDDEAVADLAANLAAEFAAIGIPERITEATLADILDEAADNTEADTGERFGDTARDNIRTRLWSEMEQIGGVVPDLASFKDDRDACQMLVEGMREADIISPPTDCLAPIGETDLQTGLETVFEGSAFFQTKTRSADVYRGDPFIVEAGIAYGGDIFADEDRHADETARVLRFANRVPLVYQRGACSTVDVIKRIDWRNYFTGRNSLKQTGGSGIPNGPLVILVHVASTNVPFTSESKDAVANVELIEDEVELALRECARGLKSHLKEQRDLEQRRTKKRVVGEVLPQIAQKAADVAGHAEPADTTRSMARIMNSVMLRPFPDGEDEVGIENYSNGTESLTLRLRFADKPTYPSQNVERVETDDGWELVWEGSIERGETDSITWNDAGKPTITYEDIADEKVSTTDRSPIQLD